MTARRLIAAAVVAAVLCGSTAEAARRYVITKSSQIKPGTVTEKHLSASARKTLRGHAGPAGVAGPAGPAGAPGAAATVAVRRVFYPIRFVNGSTTDEFPMSCPDGLVAIGGGAGTGNSGSVVARTSQPNGVLAGADSTPSAWYLYVVSTSSVFNYTPYVICAG